MGFVTAVYNKKTRNVKCDIPLTSDMIAILKLMHDNANDKRQYASLCQIEGINPLNYVVEETPHSVTIKAEVSYYETVIKAMPLIDDINNQLARHLGIDFVDFWKLGYSLTIKAKPKVVENVTNGKKKAKFFIESVDKDGLTPIYWASKNGWVSESDGIPMTLYASEKSAAKVIFTQVPNPVKITGTVV